MQRGPRIVIIGGGIAGLATAWWLGQRAAGEVVLVEREDEFGLHSSGLNASILRTGIPAGPTRQLAAETLRFLKRPPTGFAPTALLDPCGVVVITADGPAPTWEKDPASRIDELDRARLARLAPHFEGSMGRALFFAEEGRLDIRMLSTSLAQGAHRAGVDLRTGAKVSDLIVRSGRVCGVRLAGGEALEADWTVIAAGGWAGRLGRQAGSSVELSPTRRHIAVTAASDGVDPAWPIVWSDVDGFYARPEAGGLMVCSCDQTEVDPDHWDLNPIVREEISRAAARHLPTLGRLPLTRFWAGLRTLTEDDTPLVGPDAEVPGLFWVAGLGGHGMTTSMATGRHAAEMLCGEATRSGDEDLRLALSPARTHGSVHG